MSDGLSRRATLLLILLPLLAAFVGLRLYLHFVDPNRDLIIAGHEVHHLFSGALMVIPAAFVLAFGVRGRVRAVVLVVLGFGSGMVLDEVVYLVATDGSNLAYLTPLSLWGGAILVGLAVLLLLVLYARPWT